MGQHTFDRRIALRDPDGVSSLEKVFPGRDGPWTLVTVTGLTGTANRVARVVSVLRLPCVLPKTCR